ncbi:MAG: sensor histidine kinase N-terminal domain-containing protein [Burkholderiaceae bacterium]|jgi:two-component system sensor histidine kinase TctE|nr:sensor histidine kinase N-terminal domain-containing protein [Burkholderiaceae bacterium]
MTTPQQQHSLFGEILDWMLAPLLLLWPMSIFLTYLVAQSIADRPYDRDLGVVVRAIAQQASIEQLGGDTLPKVSLRMPAMAAELLRADDADNVYFQVLGTRGEFVAGDEGLPVPDESISKVGELQFRDETMRDDAVRVAYMWVALNGESADHAMLVQVAETLEKRSRLANEIIKGVIFPQFVILPLAVVLVWFALSRGIKPLSRLQQRIRKRESSDLSPIDERDVPDEVAPLVRAINELLGRLDQSIRTQKQFLADAAHQLKTPLAGLRMQAELAGREIDAGASDAGSLKKSLQQIAFSSQRAAHMVNQLLAMARAEDREQALRKQDLNLAGIVIETVRDFVPKAMDKRIDLGYEGPDGADGVRLHGQPVLVREMVRNLVDNALQYTPAGGTVTARVVVDPFGQVVVLQVEDNGPGIAEAERELVFRPFYRPADTVIDGSGLGLAIVREVAEQHGAEISVADAQARSVAAAAGTGPGTLITVRFPVLRGGPRPAG